MSASDSVIRQLSVDGFSFSTVDLVISADRQGVDIHTLPFVIRILLENLQRHRCQGKAINESELQAVAHWQNHVDEQLSLHVERVILPDSSGLPVLQDLAALRDAVRRHGGNALEVDTRVPLDLIVDHSLQVDTWGNPDAIQWNLNREFRRNKERYQFLKWAQQAFDGLDVFPPGTGIIHQVNLEKLATVISCANQQGQSWAFPDFVIGGDSHTPMVNGLGVLGWGVGGIDAESALLGRAYSFPVPEVVGVELHGEFSSPVTTTDVALLITQRLRQFGVAGAMVEFYGDAVAKLAAAERATIANMAPEYGATCGFFPVDDNTLKYLTDTGRDESAIALVEAYCKANCLWRDPKVAARVHYSRVLKIDLSEASPSMAGPRRPQDRLTIKSLARDFKTRLTQSREEGGFDLPPEAVKRAPDASGIQHGSVIIAAITSCTNTSNPSAMLTAGLVARNAYRLGLTPPSWVKRSLAPGSRVVTEYLKRNNLLADLEALGFYIIGYGCTTCGGKSGPLDPEITEVVSDSDWVVCSVLSGNRNFEGRIHKLSKANYIGSPAMVVAYALAGRVDIDFDHDALGIQADGSPIYLRDLWPTQQEIDDVVATATEPKEYSKVWSMAPDGAAQWEALEVPEGKFWQWEAQSTYIQEPPFFKDPAIDPHALENQLQEARVLAVFGDSLTTDHISPSGEIPEETPAGRYLLALGVQQPDFNTYVARRSNAEVMTRGTFANIRVRNRLAPGTEGGYTTHFPSNEVVAIYEASQRYLEQNIATIVLAGKEYGTGSSRDWAAKGTALLGVKAVLAESFERIHRANLIGMGVVPLQFAEGEGWQALGLNGSEAFRFDGLVAGIKGDALVQVHAYRSGFECTFAMRVMALTQAERDMLLTGGLPASVLAEYV